MYEGKTHTHNVQGQAMFGRIAQSRVKSVNLLLRKNGLPLAVRFKNIFLYL